ncbi:MAG: alpha/beta fold hydrolase [Myxococcales bacterium]|nr:alpha/beta fold hydrolase [Myxococcales bacterium]
MRSWLVVAMCVAACGGGGSKVQAIEVPDEVVAADAPTVPGGEELRFTAADGVTIVGTYWPPRDASTTACAVFAHQLSSTRAEYVPVIERLKGRAHLFAIDLRGHGASTQGPDGAVAWRAFETADWERVEGDLRDAVAAVRARGASGRCVMVGASIGSSATLRFVGAAPDQVAAVVLLSPGLNYRGLATPDAARATRAPVLIVHSQEQGAVDAATALANILGDNPTPVEVIADPGTAHGMTIVAGAPAVLERVSTFIGDHL